MSIKGFIGGLWARCASVPSPQGGRPLKATFKSPEFDRAAEYVIKNSSSLIERNTELMKFGITLNDLTRWRGREATQSDLITLGCDEAKSLLKAWYWDNSGIDQIEDRVIATALFDQAIELRSVKVALQKAQAALYLLGVKLEISGEMDSLTQDALDKINPKNFIKSYITQLKNHYSAEDERKTGLNEHVKRLNRLWTLI